MNRILAQTLIVATLMSSAGGGLASAPLADATAAYMHRDYATAARLIRPLAQQGNTDAQARLGDLYARGRGVPQSYAQAAQWYRLAAVRGNARAQNNLGLMYYYGSPCMPADHLRAYMWFDLAAAARNGEGVTNRVAAAVLLKPAQIARAREMAGHCRASRFKLC
jgi:hypothetical protein